MQKCKINGANRGLLKEAQEQRPDNSQSYTSDPPNEFIKVNIKGISQIH